MQKLWEEATERPTSALIVVNFDLDEIAKLSETQIIADPKHHKYSYQEKMNFYVNSVYVTLKNLNNTLLVTDNKLKTDGHRFFKSRGEIYKFLNAWIWLVVERFHERTWIGDQGFTERWGPIRDWSCQIVLVPIRSGPKFEIFFSPGPLLKFSNLFGPSLVLDLGPTVSGLWIPIVDKACGV